MKKISILLILLYMQQAFTCTTMAMQNEKKQTVVMKSFDFHFDQGYVFINKKNVMKRSLTLSMNLGKAWSSKYGSITFNQISRNFPYGGMNEKGLNMEIMWLDETQYPDVEHSTINESQVIQYILDTAATTDEALEKLKDVSIVPIMATVHFMICDRSDKCAVVEYLNGKQVVNHLGSGKERILQNSVYADILPSIQNNLGSERQSNDELNEIFLSEINEENFNDEVFKKLEVVKQGSFTVWQIAYNLETLDVSFRSRNHQTTKTINLNQFELNCRESREQVFSLSQDVDTEGNVRDLFSAYTNDVDKELLEDFTMVDDNLKSAANMYQRFFHTCKSRTIRINKIKVGK